MADTRAQIDRIMKQATDIIREEMLNGLQYLGNECVTRIRKAGREGDWMDQTGNLRSSVGYAVFDFGKEVNASTFEQVKDGATGADAGKRYAQSLASRFAQGYVLAVVAGMDYAAAVETRRDVLASTEIWAKGHAEKVIKTFKKRAEDRISKLK